MDGATQGAIMLIVLVVGLVELIVHDPHLEGITQRLHVQAVTREVGRVYTAFHDLRAHLLLTRVEFAGAIIVLIGAVTALAAYLAWLWGQTSLLFRKRLAKTGWYTIKATGASLGPTDNKVTKARFSNWTELVLLVTLQYILDPVNVVSAAVVLLQGVGSGWTKHKMNLGLYIMFYFVALVQEGYKYFLQSRADNAINHELYEAAPLNATVSVDKSTGAIKGLRSTRAESLRLGALVRVRPGQRVPIEGFIVDLFGTSSAASPFAYAVTGESTVKPGLRALPVAWKDILEMECAVAHKERVTGPMLGEEKAVTKDGSSEDDGDDAKTAEASPDAVLTQAPPPARLERSVSASTPSSSPPLNSSEADASTSSVLAASSSAMHLADAHSGLRGSSDSSSSSSGAGSGRQSLASRVTAALAGTARGVMGGVSGSEGIRRRSTAVQPLDSLARRTHAAQSEAAGVAEGQADDEASSTGADSATMDTQDSSKVTTTLLSSSKAADSGSALGVPEVQYRINRCRIPPTAGRVSTGMVHAPTALDGEGGARRDLFVLAGVPAQMSTHVSKAKDPPPSRWDETVRQVMLVQIVVVLLVSVQGWASGTVIRAEAVTLWTTFAFFAGQLVMNNGLVPVRAKLAVQLWVEVCKLLYPGVTVKRETVVETIRDARDVLSDKTGTLTVDGMAFPAPSPTPWTPPGAAAAFRLLLTNDSIHNPLFHKPQQPQQREQGVSLSDSRLSGQPALATTSEEGVIFDALTTDRPDSGTASLAGGLDDEHLRTVHARPRYPLALLPLAVPGPDSADPRSSAPTHRDSRRAPLLLACCVQKRVKASVQEQSSAAAAAAEAEVGDALLALLHYKGPFERTYVGRFAVASLFRRKALSSGAGSAAAAEPVGADALSAHRAAAAAVAACLKRLAGERRCGTARGDAALREVLEAHGWEAETVAGGEGNCWLVMQGGGDVVASCCGEQEETVRYENERLRADPNRTFGHAAACVGVAPCGLSGALTRADVVEMHSHCLSTRDSPTHAAVAAVAAAAAAVVPDTSSSTTASPYHLEFLSKFENPLARDVQAVPCLLAEQGVRFHCCTGDTLLTMSAILQRIGVLPPPAALTDGPGSARGREAIEAVAERCAVQGGQAARDLVADLSRTVQVHLGDEEAEAIAAGSDGSVLQRVWRLLLDERKRVVLLCNQRALQALHARLPRDARVRAVLRHPDAVFAFYRIAHSFKPLALRLFVRDSEDEEDERVAQAAAEKGGVPRADPIFIGDGTNDEPALQSTTHSVAIASGSEAARNASNIEVHSAAALPDVISMARLDHGGRSLVLRDVLFVGGILVALLAVSAHLVRFTPMAEGTLVIVQDPWSPFMTMVYTLLVHTPRMLVVAVTDGMQPAYRNHRFLPLTALAETAAAMVAAVWVGLMLAPPEEQRGDPAAMQEFAVMAVSSMALLVYLRQNLLVSDELALRPRLLPPLWSPGFAGLPKPHTESMRGEQHRYLPFAVWLLNGVLGQLGLFVFFCSIVARNDFPLSFVIWRVCSACAAPATVLAVFRLFHAASRLVE